MNPQIRIIAGGFILFLVSGFVNQVLQTTWVLYAGCGAFAVPLLLFVVLPMVVMPTVGDRRKAKASLHRYAKEAGLEPYTAKELKALNAEERRTHDRNAASEAFWTGSDTWIDNYGNVRKS